MILVMFPKIMKKIELCFYFFFFCCCCCYSTLIGFRNSDDNYSFDTCKCFSSIKFLKKRNFLFKKFEDGYFIKVNYSKNLDVSNLYFH